MGLDDEALLRCVVGLSPRVIVVGDSVDYILLAGIKSQAPKTGLLVLARTSRLGGTLLLAAGIGCVAQDAPVADIIEAIHLSACGQAVLVAADGRRVEPRHARQLHLLTQREREVLQHLSRGESAEEIALALRVRPETIRTHTASIRRKLNVASKRELIGIQMLRGATVEK
jgi:DNA-binding NarL/FixJ family response regulator